MPYTIDDEGQLLGDDGNQVEIEGKPVTVEGALTKGKVSEVVQERLERQKTANDEKIKALEGQANRTPELERLLQEAKDHSGDLETQRDEAKKNASEEVAQQMTKLQTETSEAKSALEAEKFARVTDQVTSNIVSEASGKFINPARDIVPQLLQAHTREPVKDDEGKITGAFVDTFRMTRENDKGEEVTESLSAKDALGVLAGRQDCRHYLCASKASGSGGGADFTNTANLKRSSMSLEEKAAFTNKHGLDKFKELPLD